MNCSCPKCHETTEVDHSVLAEKEINITCGECKQRLWVARESFARRAIRKEWKIYCFDCGNELNHLIVCRSCGAQCPDYVLVQSTKIVREKVSRSPARVMQLIPSTRDIFPKASEKREAKNETTKEAKPKKAFTYLIGVVILAALVAIGVAIYNHKKQDEEYRADFFRLLYTTKLGSELGLKKCAKLSTEWKAKIDSGQSPDPKAMFVEDGELNKARTGVEKIRQRMDKPPRKYVQLNGRLIRVYNSYNTIHSLTLAPPSSLPAFTDAVTKSESEFKQALQEVKASLPAELSDDLKEAKKKYRVLADF